MALPGVEERDTVSPVEPKPESNRQPVWHVIVLCVLTIFAYSFFWFYKNLKQLKAAALASDELPDDLLSPQAKRALASMKGIHPGLFTLGLLIPVFHILLSWRFFIWALQLYPRSNWIGGRHPIVAGAAITTVLVALLSLGFRTGPEFLFALNAALPLAFVQHLLNGFWKQIEPEDRVVRTAFNGVELIALVFGGVLLGLVAAGASMK